MEYKNQTQNLDLPGSLNYSGLLPKVMLYLRKKSEIFRTVMQKKNKLNCHGNKK